MVWGGGVFTLHLYCIRHSVIPNWGIYYTSIPPSFFGPVINYDTHNVKAEFKVDNNDIATVTAYGFLKFKRPGTVVLTATCSASENCAKAQCSTTVTTKRDGVTFTSEGLPDVIFNNTSYCIRNYLYNSKTKSGGNFHANGSFSVTSSNNAILRYDDLWLKFSGTAGEATTFSHTFIVARRDQYGTILIKDANEWKLFCKLVNDKGMTNLNARLEADVDLGRDIAMVGNDYAGTFDGQNHTLKFIWYVGSDSYIAPFKKVSGATIRNLRTEGEIHSSTHYLSGLITEAYGKTTITGCVSNVDIKSSYTGDGCAAAGMISYIGSSANVTITDCIVKGKITATMNNGKKGMGGFVYSQNGTCTLNSCLYIGENNAISGNTFAKNATLNRCYYLNACGEKQDTQVTADQLKSGEVAYLLQDRRADRMWGQNIGKDKEPLLTDDATKRVYQVSFAYNGKVKATRYTNKGGCVKLPTAKELLGADYDTQKSYTLTFENGFSETTDINGDITINVTVNVVTGIDGVTDDNADMNAPVYDLQGRYLGTSLDNLPAGIYIVGGKKVIKK